MAVSAAEFNKALAIGRPPNIAKLFPNSRGLLVSGKVIDYALSMKGKAMTMAANVGRNYFVIRGALMASQKANASINIEIVRSEGGAKAYCPTNYWDVARRVDQVSNELASAIPVTIHAYHYGIRSEKDIPFAKVEIPTIFEAGISSIAFESTRFSDELTLKANFVLDSWWPSLQTRPAICLIVFVLAISIEYTLPLFRSLKGLYLNLLFLEFP